MTAVSINAANGVANGFSCYVKSGDAGSFRLRGTGSGLIDISNSFSVTAQTLSSINFQSFSGAIIKNTQIFLRVNSIDSAGHSFLGITNIGLSLVSGTGTISTSQTNLGSGLSKIGVTLSNPGVKTLRLTCSGNPYCSGTLNTITLTVSAKQYLQFNFPVLKTGVSNQSYTIRLNGGAPSSSVTVTIGTSTSSMVTVVTSSVTFTTSD